MKTVLNISPDQHAWIEKNYATHTWAELACLFNKQFGTNRSGDALRIAYGRLRAGAPTSKPKEAAPKNPYSDFNRASIEGTEELAVRSGRFFVSSVMPVTTLYNPEGVAIDVQGPVDRKALKTILEGDADPILLAMNGHTRPLKSQESHYDGALWGHQDIMYTDLFFNENLRAADLSINPQQIKPLTGLNAYVKNTSMIVAHPRQHMRFVGTGSQTLPTMLHSTGSICLPSYQRNRIGGLAEAAHKIGGLIVELDEDRFFVRRVQFDQMGGYHDLGRYYKGGKSQNVRADALVVGDIHFGHEEAELMEILRELLDRLAPRRLVLHDFFDGLSISHWIADIFDVINRPDWAKTLKDEVDWNRYWLDQLKKWAPKDCEFVFPASNHNDFLDRYLKHQRFMRDAPNYEYALGLEQARLRGINTMGHLFNDIFDANQAKWLSEDDDYYVEGSNIAGHGHVGLNGNRSKEGVKAGYPTGVTAHGHVPITEDDWEQVGMWGTRRHGYNKGPSSWMPSVGVIYPGGSRQQIIPIKSPQSSRPYQYTVNV